MYCPLRICPSSHTPFSMLECNASSLVKRRKIWFLIFSEGEREGWGREENYFTSPFPYLYFPQPPATLLSFNLKCYFFSPKLPSYNKITLLPEAHYCLRHRCAVCVIDKLVNIDRLQYTCTRLHSLGGNCNVCRWNSGAKRGKPSNGQMYNYLGIGR